MASFRYRAATSTGALRSGTLEAVSAPDALQQLKQEGLRPLFATEASGAERVSRPSAPVTRALGELAVMLKAGIPLDRALAVVLENLEQTAARTAFAGLLTRVREGAPLSRAMAEAPSAFPPIATAMASAGEANGRSGAALEELAATLERAEQVRSTIVSALIYPLLLLVIAAGVIALMLLWVVPQFEGLFADASNQLPPITRLVLAASDLTRRYGLDGVLALVIGGVGLWRWSRAPSARLALDGIFLSAPVIGVVVRRTETARFARVLSSLVQGGVALPQALGIAVASLGNRRMAAAVQGVADGLRQGGGLTGPLAAANVLPPMAISYLRTGEETAQLGPMLARLADVLDRDVRVRIERIITVATPVITVAMGAIVATVIASIMSAIIGFDDLALSK